MSRSRKKAIYKDSGLSTSEYWRPIRREWKQTLTRVPRGIEVTWWWYDWDVWCLLNSIEFRNPKSIIDDYDYCDYIIDHEYDLSPSRCQTEEDVLKYRELLRRK